MCASHFRHFRRLRRDRQSVQGEFEASKTDDCREDADGRCSRDHQDIARPLEEPSKRKVHGRGSEARSDVRQGKADWSGVKPPSGKNGT